MPEDYLKEKKIKPLTLLFGLLIFVVGIFLLGGLAVYELGTDNALARNFTKHLPYPALFWGSNTISIAEVEQDLDSIRHFYESQDFSTIGARVDFNTEDGRKRLKIKERKIINKLIENKLIETEARKRGIMISDEQVTKEVDDKLAQYGSGQSLKDNMNKLYGWSIEDFKNKIVKPDMYKEALFADIQKNDQAGKEEKNKINAALDDLNHGIGFEDVAKKYSEGESAKNAGDLGWFSADKMLPEIVQPVFALAKGETSGIIESQLGYHIIKVEDKKSMDGVDQIKLRQIFVRTVDFADWLKQAQQNLKIHVLMKGYQWNGSTGQVEFKDGDLRNFEENLVRNSPGDVSVMF